MLVVMVVLTVYERFYQAACSTNPASVPDFVIACFF